MTGIKYLTNISENLASYAKLVGKKYASEIMPVRSRFKGLKLAPLPNDTVVLKPEPKKYASQAEKLKDLYNSKGFPYLLPHEEWSDKKIHDTVNILGNHLDKLVETKRLNKKTLQKAIEKIAPEIKGKIIIKDFNDLEKDLTARKVSPEIIKMHLKCNAFSSSGINTTTLYFKFGQLNEGNLGQTLIKTSIEHELTHALTSKLQNTSMMDIYKNNYCKCSNQTTIFNKIFSTFERIYTSPIHLSRTKLTQKDMLETYGFKSIKSLHNNFEKELNKIIETAKSTGELNIGTGKKGWKQFFNYLKNAAKGEENAFQANKRLREIYKDFDYPTEAELKPLFYHEMGNFFSNKRIQVNKRIAS